MQIKIKANRIQQSRFNSVQTEVKVKVKAKTNIEPNRINTTQINSTQLKASDIESTPSQHQIKFNTKQSSPNQTQSNQIK